MWKVSDFNLFSPLSLLVTLYTFLFDTDGGKMDFYEFLEAVMPKDYTRTTWNIARDEEAEVIEAFEKTVRGNTEHKGGDDVSHWQQRHFPLDTPPISLAVPFYAPSASSYPCRASFSSLSVQVTLVAG